MSWLVHRGRIQTWALESHIVDHCNLRCEHCCTRSPMLPPRAIDPEALERDLTLAARVLQPQVFKLTGGEPLLHPDLPACVEAARRSGISTIISITTNGFLAPRLPESVWRGIDRLTLSLYASAPLPDDTLLLIDERCRQHGILLRLKAAPGFHRMDRDAPSTSAGETDRVFRSCWLRTRCHMVYRGRFYQCTRPPHMGGPGQGFTDDGIVLDAPDLLRRLLDDLNRTEPLEACSHCLGGSGAREPHRQLERVPVFAPGCE